MENATSINQEYPAVVTNDFNYDAWGLSIETLFNPTYSSTFGSFNSPNPQHHRYNGKEQISTSRFYDYGARQYDPVIGRWLSVDPLAHLRSWVSPYNFVQNNPINRVDPDGALDAPIYDTDGEFLGTDNEGLQGKAIVMNKEDFTQGMSHGDALSKSKGAKGLSSDAAKSNLLTHYSGLKDRPDYDGYLTKKEADNWWLGKSGQPLFVDQSKVELPGITTKSFENKKGSYFYKNFVWGLSNTGKVYGTLKLTLTNPNTGSVHLGGAKYMDEYDFTMDGRWA
jgi:RHS repeat-associated protein